MIISWIFTFIFLIVIFCEIYFLGAYFAITQDMFHNKTLATFLVGALFYFMLTIIATFPFIWFDFDLIYYAIILLFKDFFTVVFLVIQRDKFYKFRTEGLHILFLGASIILIPIFYTYILEPYIDIQPIEATSKYQSWHTYSDALALLTQTSETTAIQFIIYPLSAAIIYASVASLFLEFSRKTKYWNAILSLITTFIVIGLFNLNISLEDGAFIGFYVFMFLIIYHLIIHARRRFGILFGISCFVIWSISSDNIWPLTLISISTFAIYLLLKRPRPSVFLMQLIAPILVIWALNLSDFSNILSIFVSIIGIIAYSSIIAIVRIKWVEKTNRTFAHKNFRYLFLAMLLSILIILNLVIFIKGDFSTAVFYTGNEIFADFNIPIMSQILNISYYVVLGLTSLISLFNFLIKAKMINAKLAIFISFIFCLLCFNPLMQAIFLRWVNVDSYHFVRCVVIMPLLIVTLAKLPLPNVQSLRYRRNKNQAIFHTSYRQQ